ncbi:MAG: YwaF family protein [Clostridia bacterium]|nr:YwaF family protein [Clostridia bacterium]
MQNTFWMHKSIYTQLGGKGFSFFSLPHLIWLAVLVAAIALFAFVYRVSSAGRRGNIRKGAALFLILFEIGKQCVLALTGAPVAHNLPLHFCSFAEYAILIDALWPENRLFKPLLCYAFLPAAFVALLFPTTTAYAPISFYPIHHFILHACIVAYILARYAAGEIRLDYKGLWIAFFSLCVLVIPLYFLDAAFDTNYVFLIDHDNNPAFKLVWDLSGGTGGISYILGLGVLGLVVLHATYGIFAAVKAFRKRLARNR